jgi:hypothetical protein
MQTLYLDNDNVIELTSLSNGMTGEALNTAAVGVTLLDAAGDPISGPTWPISMGYVPNSAGTYRGLLPSTTTLTHNSIVTALVAVSGDGLTGEWRTTMRVIKRG